MARKRRIRTIFCGDQGLTPGELELLHTPALQRLYDLHQLGLTDRVFIDASHSRLHHVVGVVEQADKLISAIADNLKREAKLHIRQSLSFGSPESTRKQSVAELSGHVTRRRAVARLMGLLHDLTHAPYGHTLEDEIQLMDGKHDEPDRQADAFYRLLCQLIGWLARENSDHENGRSTLLPPDSLAFCTYLDHADLLDPPPVAEVLPVAVSLLSNSMAAQRMGHDFGPKALSILLRNLNVAMQALGGATRYPNSSRPIGRRLWGIGRPWAVYCFPPLAG